MDIAAVLALYDREQRIDIEFPDMRKEVLPRVVRFLRPAPGSSTILHTSLDEDCADAVIDEQLAFFRDNALQFSWKVYEHDAPPDLAARLAARGLEVDEEEAIMALDLHEVPASLLAPLPDFVRRLTHPDQVEDVIRVLTQVWGEDFAWMRDRFPGYMELPGYISVYVAYAGDEPACAGWLIDTGRSQFASLWGGSTVEAFRGRGFYSAVLAARVQEAIARGFRYLTIDASPMSRPIVARHGFQLLTHARDCDWKPPASDPA